MSDNKPSLNNPEIQPTADVLQNVLGKNYTAFEELSTILINEYCLTMNGKYYIDSKAGLCKVAYKKKTIFWLSVGEGYFKTSFFFLERHIEGITKLDTNENSFILTKEGGKMIPVIFEIHRKEQFDDLLKLVVYKKELKH